MWKEWDLEVEDVRGKDVTEKEEDYSNTMKWMECPTKTDSSLVDVTPCKMVEDVVPKLRMMNVVLMEPKNQLPPPKRKKRVAKKTTDPKTQGTIHKYLYNLQFRKECTTIPVEGARAPNGMRKRKGEMLEESEQSLLTKSRRIDDDITTTSTTDDSRTISPLLGGGEFQNWEGTNGRTNDGNHQWVKFIGSK